MRLIRNIVLAAMLLAMTSPVFAQQATIVQSTTPASNIVLVPISMTAAINTATVLTIPAPAGGLYNYVCSLAFQVSNNATGATITNQVSTSTNFNSFAVKWSQLGTVNIDGNVQTVLNSHGPTDGCAKSTSPGVATTFTSPAALAQATWTWYATYFQAP